VLTRQSYRELVGRCRREGESSRGMRDGYCSGLLSRSHRWNHYRPMFPSSGPASRSVLDSQGPVVVPRSSVPRKALSGALDSPGQQVVLGRDRGVRNRRA